MIDSMADDVVVDEIVVAFATAPTNANIDATGMSRFLLLLLMLFMIKFLMVLLSPWF